MAELILWFIDDDAQERRTYHREFHNVMPATVRVKAIAPYQKKEECLHILEDPQTSCVIIDQRLHTTGSVAYSGIDLAQYLRGVNKKIPMYIFTNFEDDDFSEGEWSIEYVISKTEWVGSNDYRQIIISRITRHMNIYQDILASREQRFNELLRKSLEDQLEESDLHELEELKTERAAAVLASELGYLSTLEQAVRRLKNIESSLQGGKDEGE